MYTVDVFPAHDATDRDEYRIEIVLEAVNGGTWDSTDEVDGQVRYRLSRPSREAAEVTANELIAMGLNASIRVGPPAQDLHAPLPAHSLRRRTAPASAA